MVVQGGWTPLHAAQDKNQIDIGKLLIKFGADPDIQGDVSLLYLPLSGNQFPQQSWLWKYFLFAVEAIISEF